jgi:hypothetical protein
MGEAKGGHLDSGKPMVQLIDPHFLLGVGAVLGYGAGKYGANNWQGGIHVMRLAGSVLRHFLAWLSGMDLDDESGLPHLYHAATDLMMIDWTLRCRADLDDRSRMS